MNRCLELPKLKKSQPVDLEFFSGREIKSFINGKYKNEKINYSDKSKRSIVKRAREILESKGYVVL